MIWPLMLSFAAGPALASEPVLTGEPNSQAHTSAALHYIDALTNSDVKASYAGLDHLDEGKMIFQDRESWKFGPISFEAVKVKLHACKIYEGRPRRYDRDSKRVFAFDSGWNCMADGKPYTTTVFVEINDGRVIGGRIIEHTRRNVIVQMPVGFSSSEQH